MLNKAQIIGYLGKDPETRFAQSGDAICNVSVATTEKWKDKNTGEVNEKTEWHRITMFGKLAEIAQKYLVKGSLVYLSGRIQTRKWQDQSGNDRYSTEIIADELKMLGGKGDSAGGSGAGRQGATQGGKGPSQPDFDDDLPF